MAPPHLAPQMHPTASPIGGDLRSCIAASELDAQLAGITVMSADIFWQLAQGHIHPEELVSFLSTLALPALFIIHVRHHWVAARLTGTAFQVADSARSVHVEKDLRKLQRLLRLPPLALLPAPQQERGSQECGVFAALFILIWYSGLEIPTRTDKVSLSSLRQLFGQRQTFLEEGCKILGLRQPRGDTVRRNNPYASVELVDIPVPSVVAWQRPQPELKSNATQTAPDSPRVPTPPTAPSVRYRKPAVTVPARRANIKQKSQTKDRANPSGGSNDSPPGAPRRLRISNSRRETEHTREPSLELDVPVISAPRPSRDHNREFPSDQIPSVSQDTSQLDDPLDTSDASTRQEAPRSQRLTHAALRRMIRSWAAGTVVQVEWSSQRDAGVWAGRVVAISGLFATVRFMCTHCQLCDRWHDLDPVEVAVPAPRVMFFNARVLHRLPRTAPADDCMEVLGPQAEDRIVGDEQRQELDAFRQEVRRQREVANEPFREDALPNAALGTAPPTVLRGNAGRRWFLYPGRPPHVHTLVWKQLAPATRALHRTWLDRVRGMPADLSGVSLGSAVVELVLRSARNRRWAWSTIAAALSTVNSALRALPMYTSEMNPVDVSKDPFFASAMRRAQHLARVTAIAPNYRHLTVEAYRQVLRGVRLPSVRLLLQLSWHLAARVGDVRQLRPSDIILRPQEGERQESSSVTLSARFRFGKGAAFWGPYTITVRVPKEVAKLLTALVRERQRTRDDQATDNEPPIFTLADQGRLSEAMKVIPGLSLRSIRRGMLLHAANSGVTEDALQLLSGHRRRDTLLRYLGWGREAAAARQAADERGVLGGEAPHATVRAPVMGPHSGKSGHKGQRTQPPPHFVPLKAPSQKELGIDLAPGDNPNTWPLHVKRIGLLRWSALHRVAHGSPFDTTLCERWCSDASLYGADPEQTIALDQVPIAKLTREQVQTLLDFGKLQPYDGPIRGSVKAWLLPQVAKRRLRPIFEPRVNETLCRERLPTLKYPARHERRTQVRGMRFALDFDFSTYFDAFELSSEVHPYFVLRVREEGPGRTHRTFSLTRLPMGAAFAPGVAQWATWALVYRTLRGLQGSVVADTMIDNVRFASNDRTAFLKAVRVFVRLVSQVGVTLNEQPPAGDDEILQRASQPSYTFLGEVYLRNTHVCNTESTVSKTVAAYTRWVEHPECVTRRQFAALIGIAFYAAGTLGVRLASLHTLLRAYAAIFRDAGGSWDDITPPLASGPAEQLRHLVALIAGNNPVEIGIRPGPSFNEADYDATIFVDASAAGWAAIVSAPVGQYLLQQRWRSHEGASASAEPRAADAALRWTAEALTTSSGARIALATDHSAMVLAQEDPRTRHRGFSANYWLNRFLQATSSDAIVVDVFHVSGEVNPADTPSRNPPQGFRLEVKRCEITVPSLRELHHPYLTSSREEWFV